LENIVSYLTAFGLATGAGTKATIPVIALGLFHHTRYFELSPRWEWIASPPVPAVPIALLPRGPPAALPPSVPTRQVWPTYLVERWPLIEAT